MVITVTATTTNGRSLTKEELARVMSACDVALELDAAKRRIQEYVESRMSFIAPNLTAILGSTVATKLMGHAGGLTALSKIPACNILVLGAQKKTNTGLSRISMGRHAGFVYQCDLVQQLPDELRRKAARLMSAKCALAARIDCVRESVDGMAGKLYREDIEKKIAVMLQPPPSQKTKALPIPDEGPKKRRGGRRVRKAKERTAQTDLRKAQNRMVFGEAEEEYGFGDETVGLGMVGRQTGKIRGTQLDTRVKVSVAKKHRAFASHSAHTSGLSSSVAFTPVKGIELENPEIALQRVKEANIKYFSGGQFKKPAAK
ncbi:U4/U6-U5 snRNP complex subunit prp31, variant 4 [Batrachochytrium dendrobatidis]|nr:U4/U6-U5 snRNP complex subunit prp31, variant 4 [Batrachochytrium dendrobatidis]